MRAKFRTLDGIVLLDKPLGLSSNHALQKVRHLYQAKKAGHAGTLDPMATGLLVICFGEATKFSSALLDADKRYEAVIQLGVTTETADAEGAIIATKPVHVSQEDLKQALTHFCGTIQQVPSMYSALKHQGKPLYQLARQGITVERKAREITVHTIELLAFSHDRIHIQTTVSKGTYIRNLAEDIGEHLGCGAHLASLRRLDCGAFHAEQMVSLETLIEAPEKERYLLPVDSALKSLPALSLTELQAQRLSQGQKIVIPEAPPGIVRLTCDERFLGVGEVAHGGVVSVRRLVANLS